MVTYNYQLGYKGALHPLVQLFERTETNDSVRVCLSVTNGKWPQHAVSNFLNMIDNLPEVRELLLMSQVFCPWKEPSASTSWLVAIPLLHHIAPHLELLEIQFEEDIRWTEFDAFTTSLALGIQLEHICLGTNEWFPLQFNELLSCLCHLPKLKSICLPPVPHLSDSNPLIQLVRKPTVRKLLLNSSYIDQPIFDILEEMQYNDNLTHLILPGLVPQHHMNHGNYYIEAINCVIQHNQFLQELHLCNLSSRYMQYCIISPVALRHNQTLECLTFQHNPNYPVKYPGTHMSTEEVNDLTEVILHHNDVLKTLLFDGYCPCPEMEFYLKLNACGLPCLVSPRNHELTSDQWKAALIENSGDPRIVFCLLLYRPSILKDCSSI